MALWGIAEGSAEAVGMLRDGGGTAEDVSVVRLKRKRKRYYIYIYTAYVTCLYKLIMRKREEKRNPGVGVLPGFQQKGIGYETNVTDNCIIP